MPEKIPAAIELHCFGSFAVSHQQRAIAAFSTDKVRALLVYLALESGQPHRREALAGLLWPEMGQSAALNNLRLALHRLRETLDKVQPDLSALLIQSTRQTIQLDPTYFTVDVQRFQGLLQAAATHAHAQLTQCPACRQRLVQAVELYRGEFLAGFGLSDADAFEEWLLLRRESWHQQALGAIQLLVQSCEQAGDDAQAHHYAGRQLALDPSREEAHRQLMRILDRRGLHSEALAQYESCRRILREQLDVDPDLETVALYAQIRLGNADQPTTPTIRPQADPQPTAQPPITQPPNHLVTQLPSHPLAPLPEQTQPETPEVTQLYGRQAEQAQVVRWLRYEQCRVVALLGMGGLGKTTLAAAAVKTVAPHFDRVVWRSLLNAPPLDDLLRDLLPHLAATAPTALPTDLERQLALLLDRLRQTHCLLVLDNLESILQPEQPGQMRMGYGGYAQLLQTVAEHSHQSVLLLTSRERPQGLARREEDSPLVRTLLLDGLDPSAGQAMLRARGLSGTPTAATNLVARYSGNPLALKLVAQTVQELFGGDMGAFLAVDAPIFDDIRVVLDQQFARLSALEQELLLWLAVERVPVTAPQLRANLVEPPPMPRFLEALRALQRRSLLETVGHGFALQNVVIEYLTDRLIDQCAQEISAEQPDWLRHYALSKAQSKEYVRQSQARLILQPLAQRLVTHFGRQELAAKLQRILAGLHHSAPAAHRMGYTAGNLLQLLLAIGIDLTGYDFSHQNLWQVDLRNVELVAVNLTGADLRTALFTDAFRTVLTVVFSQDGRYLAACGVDGIVRLWRTADWQQQQELVGHHGELRALAFAPSQAGQPALLASGGADQIVRIWEQESGQLLFTLPHAGWVVDLAFVPVSDTSATPQLMLVSACWDHLVYLWNAHTGVLIATLAGHIDRVHEVAVSPDGQWLASAGRDRTVRLWRIQTAQLHHTWSAHTSAVTTVAFSADGTLLASGSWDCTVCLWEVHTRRLLHTLPHPQHLATLAFSPDGTMLATAGEDLLIRLWQVASGQLVRVISGHTSSISALDWSPDGTMLVSCSHDQSVRLWDGRNGQLLHLLVGRTQRVQALVVLPTADQTEGQGIQLISSGEGNALYFWEVWPDGHYRFLRRLPAHSNTIGASLALSSDGEWLITGSFDQTVGVWRANSGELVQRLRGHTEVIGTVACGPVTTTGASLLASVANDHIFLWDRHSGRVVQRLMGDVCTLAFHPHPSVHLLAGAGGDKVITLWDVTNGHALCTYHGHTRGVLTLAFHPAGELLASGSWDRTIRLWDLNRGACVQVLTGHSGGVLAVTFEQAGELLASAGEDATICLWAVRTGQCLARLSGHTHAVAALAFLPAPSGFVRLVSGSDDETIKIWEVALPTNAGQHDESTISVAAGRLLATLRAPGPYAGMNISGVTGISNAQKAALLALGAVADLVVPSAKRITDAATEQPGVAALDVPALPASPPLPVTRSSLGDSPLAAAAPPHNLPVQLTSFVGRTAELTAILDQLADPNVRLLTLVGAGGMGKTRLAIETAQRLFAFGSARAAAPTQEQLTANGQPPTFPDGLFFVPLTALNRGNEVAIAVAAALDLNLTGGDPQQMVSRFLQTKQLLLILDNFEHLLITSGGPADDQAQSAVHVVAALLQSAPGVKILVTSREKLNLPGEQIYGIHGMEIATATMLATAEAAAAVQLFVQRARRVQPGFALTAKNLPALVRICQLVEGMPLGLELAAAWVEILTLAEIAQEIEQSLDFLRVDWPQMPVRQRSMRGVFEWSWHLLSAAERQLLRQLAIFRGGFGRTAAEQVAGASLRLLTSLLQKSLIRRNGGSGEGGSGRFELHELLRQFAAEQLALLPDEQLATAARHSTFYLAFAAARERRLARNEPKEAASEIQSELDNVRQAWLWAVQHDSWSAVADAAYALRLFYTFTSLEPEGEQYFELAIVRLRDLPAVRLQGLRSKLLGFQAILQIAQLKHREAQQAAEAAIAINAALPADQRNSEGATFGPLALGMVLSLNTPDPAARTLLVQAIDLAQQYQTTLAAGQPPLESLYDAEWVARLSLRDLDRYADDYPGAVAHIQHAVAHCRSLGKVRGEMVCLTHLADPLIKVHDYVGAQEACAQSLALARKLENRWGEAFSLHYLGTAARLLGQYGEARTLLEQAYALIQVDSDLAQEAMVAGLLGHLYNLLGATDIARSWFDRFLALLQQFHEPWDEAEIEGLLPLARFYQQQGDHAQALHYATRGWQIALRYGWRQNQAQALILCAQAEASLHQVALATSSYQRALALCQALADQHLGAEAQAGLAQLALAQGDLATAQRQVEAILAVLTRYPQAGLDEPFTLYVTCFRVLAATGDPRARAILQRGYDLLHEYADQINDESLRAAFFEKVDMHRALQQYHANT